MSRADADEVSFRKLDDDNELSPVDFWESNGFCLVHDEDGMILVVMGRMDVLVKTKADAVEN